jgi:hypothetical protein
MNLDEDMYADNGTPMQIEANMYDHTIIKGLQINRKLNGTVDDYTINNDIDQMGFISYIPKYIQNPENFSDPKINKSIHDDAHGIIFRAYCNFKCGYKLTLKDKNGVDMIKYPKDYTWSHVGVFETEMKRPSKFSKWSLSESFLEWV